MPGAGEIASFSDADTYTVTFPSGGFDNSASLLVTKTGGTTTFDTTGTWWRMPASTDGEGASTYAAFYPLSFVNGTLQNFYLTQSGPGAPMLLSNAVFSVTGGDVHAFQLDQGYLDLYDPDGASAGTNTLYLGAGGATTLTFANGTSSRLPAITWSGKKATEQRIRFEGGTHEFVGKFGGKPAQNATSRVEVVNGAQVSLAGGLGFTGNDAIRVLEFDASGAGSYLSITGGGVFTPRAGTFIARDGATLEFGTLPYLTSANNCTHSFVVDDATAIFNSSVGLYAHATSRLIRFHATNSVIKLAGGIAAQYTIFELINSTTTNTAALSAGIPPYGYTLIKGGSYYGSGNNGSFTTPKASVSGVGPLFEIEDADVSVYNVGNENPGSIYIRSDMTVRNSLYAKSGAGGVFLESGTVKATRAYATYAAAGTGGLQLLGGVLKTGSVYLDSGTKPRIVGNGGTIQPTAASTKFLYNNKATIPHVLVGSKGLTIDTAYDVTASVCFTNLEDEAGVLIKAGKGTLTLSGAESWHDRTVVRKGTVLFPTTVTAHSSLVATNGGTIALASGHAGLTVPSLTLGDSATRGLLSLDNGCCVTVTNEDGFSPANARIVLSDLATDGTYPIVVVAGEASAANTTAWAANSSCPLSAGKGFTFTSSYSSENDATTFSVVIGESTATQSDIIWTGSGSDWTTGANWQGGSAPTGYDTAHFVREDAPATVAVASGAKASSLLFGSEQSYKLTGTTPFPLSQEEAGSILVTNGSHEIAVPLDLCVDLPVTVSSGASLKISRSVTSSDLVLGALVKEGPGTLTLSAANDLPAGLVAGEGTLAVTDADVVGANPLTLAGGVFSYEGTADELEVIPLVAAASSTEASVFHTDADLVLPDGYTASKGAFIKTGAGMLDVYPTNGAPLSAPSSAAVSTGSVVFDGVAPTNGFVAFNVAEGELRVHGGNNGLAQYIPKISHSAAVGINTAEGTVQPKLVFKDGIVNTGTITVGYNLGEDAMATNPSLVAIDASRLTTSIYLGNSACTATFQPGLYLTNSTVSGIAAFSDAPKGKSIIRAVNSTLSGYTTDWSNECDLDFDNSTLELGDQGASHLWMYANSRGRFYFHNKSILSVNTVWERANKASSSYVDEIVFDDAILRTTGGTFNQKTNYLHWRFLDGGMTLRVTKNTALFQTTIVGTGDFTKDGAGTLFFSGAMNGGSKVMADPLTMDWPGLTTVAGGTLAITTGVCRVDADFAVNQGAVLNLKTASFDLGEISGAGAVSNGTLTATTLVGTTNQVLSLGCVTLDGATYSYPIDDGTTELASRLSLADCTFATGVTVDFGRTRDNPLVIDASGPIASYSGTTAPDISSWSITGLGGHRSIASLRAEDGYIYLTLQRTPAATMLIVH